MGLSYEQFLVAAPVGPVVAALAGVVRRGYALQVGRRMTAVIVDEHAQDWNLHPIASRLSRDVESDVLVAAVLRSEVLWLTVYREGIAAPAYCSHPDHGREIVRAPDGTLRFADDRSVYDPDGPGSPPSGVEPGWFAAFAGPDTTVEGLTDALADRVADPNDPRAGKRHIFAERIYGDVLGALGLPRDPAFLPFAILDAMARETGEPDPSLDGLPESTVAQDRQRRERLIAQRADYASAYPLGDALPIPSAIPSTPSFPASTPSESTIT